MFALQHKLAIPGMIEVQGRAFPVLQGMASQTVLSPLVIVWVFVATGTLSVINTNVAHTAIRAVWRLQLMTCFTWHLLVLSLKWEIGLAMVEGVRVESDK